MAVSVGARTTASINGGESTTTTSVPLLPPLPSVFRTVRERERAREREREGVKGGSGSTIAQIWSLRLRQWRWRWIGGGGGIVGDDKKMKILA
ncbi:hypothetical protein HYC85_014322 [Camellia sinensis]|uniref:Uncharacterized protein n=1 Tax=Camellia sinensis TaxID=4442 RepID=A0A7J7H761_CAMSI|nr:hypothetical protein HYC85_014322 [Camellia sinensis]